MSDFDAVVIGSGPGGYVAGIRLGQLGKKTLVVEREKAGGVCLNVGCIPSKALIHAAKMYEKIRHAGELGISVSGETQIDWAATQKWKSGIVTKMTGGVRQLLKANGVSFVEGEASMSGPGAVSIRRADGTTQDVTTDAVILALGSRPVEIPGFAFDHEHVLDSTDALALTAVPPRLVVVGGGYIGLELGTVYAKLGCQVTVVEALPSILAGMDAECVQVVARKLKKLGVTVMLNAKAKRWEKTAGGLAVVVEQGGQEASIEADKILVTVGRRPNTDQPWVASLGLKIERGLIGVDRQLRTSVPGIYAIGDCVPGLMLAHKASRDGEVAAEVIAGRATEMDAKTIPAVCFTDPEVASSGPTEESLRAAGKNLKVGKFPFGALGRALAMNEPDGFAKVIVDADSGKILAMHIVGAAASDLIAEGALAIETGADAHRVANTVHAHPTFPEAVMEAAKGALGEAIHFVNKR